VNDSSKVSASRITLLGNTGEPVVVDITQPDPPPAVEKLREAKHTKAREVIDDVGDVLMSPFTWIADGRAVWVQRLLYSALALLVYGVFGLYLADRLRRWADQLRRQIITDAEEKAAAERRSSGSYASPA
jgi:hypothetical protein